MRASHTRGIRRVAVVVAATFGALYLVNLGRLVLANQRVSIVEQHLATQVAADRRAIDRLETETARASSDTYVETFARDELGWAQPGDRVLEPVAPDTEAAGPSPLEPQGPHPSFWDRMRQWFKRSEPQPTATATGDAPADLPGAEGSTAPEGAPGATPGWAATPP